MINLATLRFWLTLAAIIWLLGSIGLGWLVKSLVFLFGLLLVLPIIGFLGLQWWLRRNLIQDQCPVCHFQLSGINNTQMRCPNCNEALKIENRHFQRLTPPGTIDVQAVEVSAQTVED